MTTADHSDKIKSQLLYYHHDWYGGYCIWECYEIKGPLWTFPTATLDHCIHFRLYLCIP